MVEHVQVDVHALQMDYARQQANADQQYEEWVQNCGRLRYAVSVAGTSLLQERLAVLERTPPPETPPLLRMCRWKIQVSGMVVSRL